MYHQGLKDNVKDKLIRTKAEITNLEDLVKEAIKLDNKLYKRAIKKRHKGGTPRQGYYKGGSRKKAYQPNLYKHMFIELNTI